MSNSRPSGRMPDALVSPNDPAGQRLLADLQRAETPGTEGQAFQMELQQVFEKAVL